MQPLFQHVGIVEDRWRGAIPGSFRECSGDDSLYLGAESLRG
jgi:hypothetical protein